MEALKEWLLWHRDPMVLTAVCAVIWAFVHEGAKAAVKKLLGIPYDRA